MANTKENGQQPELVNITINDIELQVPKGELMVEAAKRIGIDIPIFCYHPRMTPVGMCRMCLVEIGTKQPDGSVRKMPKPQTACTLPAQEGLVMYTDTEQIVKDRKGVVEFLLINHPLDCPICDRGGECPLQNNTLFYGPGKSRFIEEKRHEVKAYPISDYVVLDRERCIHCGRCTRFTEEVSGDHQLAFLFRGNDMKIATYNETKFNSKFSGNVIEICPVGALTNRKYRFRARPWDLKTQKSLCSKCSNGCNTFLDTRFNKLVRMNGRTNEGVNEEWTCDKGKFGSFYLNTENRLTEPMVRKNGQLTPVSWAEAYETVLSKFAQIIDETGPHAVAGLGGERTSNEDNYMFQKLFRAGFGTNNLDHRMSRNQLPVSQGLFARLGAHTMQNSIESIQDANSVFVFGADLAEEQPIVYLRVRKTWFRKGAKVVVAYPNSTEVDDFASVSLHYKPGSEVALVAGLLNLILSAPGYALQPEGLADLKASLKEFTPDWTERETGVSRDLLQAAANALGTPDGLIVLAGSLVQNHPQVSNLIDALANLVIATGNADQPNGGLNLLVPECNSQGALDMGLVPDALPGYRSVSEADARLALEEVWGAKLPAKPGFSTQGILDGLAAGDIRAVYLMGCNPLTRYHDSEAAQRALEGAEFVVVQDIQLTELVNYADVVLPAAAYAERQGTYTNVERRVQLFYPAWGPQGSAKQDWDILAELYMRWQTVRGGRPTPPPFNPKDVMKEIARVAPIYAGCTYNKLGENGVRWEYGTQKPAPKLTPVRYTPPVALV